MSEPGGTGSDRDAHTPASVWKKLPTRRCAERPAAGLWGNASRTEVSSHLRWRNRTNSALCRFCLPQPEPRHGAPPCSNWRDGRRAVHLIVLRSRTIGALLVVFIYLFFCVCYKSCNACFGCDGCSDFFLEHSENGYVIILFFGFKYLFLTRSNTHFEARFSRYLFFHYRFVEHALRRTTSCRAHI